MENVRSFEGFPALTEIQDFLVAQKDTPFQTSELYSSAQDAKIIDLDKRNSRFRLLHGEEVFDLDDQTVQWLTESDKDYSYQLRRDDITETRYGKGGFFLKHEDFLSVSSNLVEEFTLILCVTPNKSLCGGCNKDPIKGGETLIFPYASEKGVAFDTTTPGRGLLFRKDIEHAGNLLENGEKHILTANLWATRKQSSHQVLFVTFPTTAAEEDDPTDADATRLLQEATNQDTSYALPVDCLKGTMLDAHVRFVNQGHEQKNDDQDLPAVITYPCTDYSFEEFGTVAKILQRSYVHEQDIERHAASIEFFGPFPNENLLVNLSVEKTTLDAAKDKPSCDRFTKSIPEGDQKLPSKKKSKTTKSEPKSGSDNVSEATEDFDVIVCENESRTQVVNTVARQLGIDYYVPFKMLFIEGVVYTGYYDKSSNVSVAPIALLVGDYNHVFSLQKVGGSIDIEPRTFQECHEEYNYWSGEGCRYDPEEDEELGGDDYDDDYDDYDFNAFAQGCGLGLLVALGEGPVRNELIGMLSRGMEDGGIGIREFRPFWHFAGRRLAQGAAGDESDQDVEPDSETESSFGEETSTTARLFHRDESGKATFTRQEATAASNFIATMDLDERVKAAIQKKRFELTQESRSYNDYYCNESVYANLNILLVTGLVRLQYPAVASAATSNSTSGKKPHFDAWPTKSQLKEARRQRQDHFNSMGMPMPFDY